MCNFYNIIHHHCFADHQYGPRMILTKKQRQHLAKERNKTHAKSTRLRKKVFARVLEYLRTNSINTQPVTCNSVASSQDVSSVNRIHLPLPSSISAMNGDKGDFISMETLSLEMVFQRTYLMIINGLMVSTCENE